MEPGVFHLKQATAFYGACLLTIAFVVFLSATQPFILTDLLGYRKKVATHVGNLAVADEIVSIIVAPALGALSDKIGTRIVTSVGVCIIGTSIMLYTTRQTLYPDILIFRCLFSVGASAAGSMITAMLSEISQSTISFSFFGFHFHSDPPEAGYETDHDKRKAILPVLVGISTGLGAVFSLLVFLRLPSQFPTLSKGEALQRSYLIVGAIAVVASGILYLTLYQDPNKSLKGWIRQQRGFSIAASVNNEERPEEQAAQVTTPPYGELIKQGFVEMTKERSVMLAYAGGFVARSTTVATAVFIPTFVNQWYHNNGYCGPDRNYKGTDRCEEAYIMASIISGVTQLVALLTTPVWGFAVSKFGRTICITAAALFGLVSSWALCLVDSPQTAWFMVLCGFIGVGQIGVIITSMSYCTDVRAEIRGSIAGVYSLFGGAGILILTKVGFALSDEWSHAGFFVLGAFDLMLLSVIFFSSKFGQGFIREIPSVHL